MTGCCRDPPISAPCMYGHFVRYEATLILGSKTCVLAPCAIAGKFWCPGEFGVQKTRFGAQAGSCNPGSLRFGARVFRGRLKFWCPNNGFSPGLPVVLRMQDSVVLSYCPSASGLERVLTKNLTSSTVGQHRTEKIELLHSWDMSQLFGLTTFLVGTCPNCSV